MVAQECLLNTRSETNFVQSKRRSERKERIGGSGDSVGAGEVVVVMGGKERCRWGG